MRVISGIHKGRKIQAPKKLPVRPTTDMAKEALFNILNNTYDFTELRVLDLFAGTGNLSYEFASRGVEDVTAVDKHAACMRFIEQTATNLNLPIVTIKSDVYKFLENATGEFDIIVADPPYNLPLESFERIPQLVFEKELLSESGQLIIEHSPQTRLEGLPHYEESRRYGSSIFSFFSWG